MNKSDLQVLADEISMQAKHIAAQRFVIQSLWVVLRHNGAFDLKGDADQVFLLAEAAFGVKGAKPNSETLAIIKDMIGPSQTNAMILPFPKA